MPRMFDAVPVELRLLIRSASAEEAIPVWAWWATGADCKVDHHTRAEVDRYLRARAALSVLEQRASVMSDAGQAALILRDQARHDAGRRGAALRAGGFFDLPCGHDLGEHVAGGGRCATCEPATTPAAAPLVF